jgi:hypothetical protein
MSDIPKWKFQEVLLADVKELPNNPRVMDEGELSGLSASIARFGYVEHIIWNETTGHIISGNQRYAVLLRAGVKKATMVVVNLPPEEELAASLTLNNPAIEGAWKEEVNDLMYQVELADSELFQSLNMETLRASLENLANKSKDKKEWDAECPCCKHRWLIGPDDVSVK